MTPIILSPRLDVPFKFEAPVPPVPGPTPPVRVPWANTVKHLEAATGAAVMTAPMWQFSPERIPGSYDVVFVPHKEPHNFPLPGRKALYYMQTVIPEYFTIDPNGWGSNLSFLPINVDERPTAPMVDFFEQLRKRIDTNVSKFDQPSLSIKFPFSDYVLFVCQIPHDESIKYHSKVTVPQALETTLKWAQKRNLPVVVKGHPANLGAMMFVGATIAGYDNVTYVDNVSIHECLAKAKYVFMVNSGTGFEALIHNKPVFYFGHAEYAPCAAKVTRDPLSIDFAISNFEFSEDRNIVFLYRFFEQTYDSRDPESFRKVRRLCE